MKYWHFDTGIRTGMVYTGLYQYGIDYTDINPYLITSKCNCFYFHFLQIQIKRNNPNTTSHKNKNKNSNEDKIGSVQCPYL